MISECCDEQKESKRKEQSYGKETLGGGGGGGTESVGKTKVLGMMWDCEKVSLKIDLSKVGKIFSVMCLRRGLS